MRLRIARLFTIKTRTEAWLVIYALALGAVERGRHYLETYQGVGGLLLALACTGVVFLAGAKLLDSVKGELQPAKSPSPVASRNRAMALNRSRPRLRQSRFGSRLPHSPRTGSRPTRLR